MASFGVRIASNILSITSYCDDISFIYPNVQHKREFRINGLGDVSYAANGIIENLGKLTDKELQELSDALSAAREDDGKVSWAEELEIISGLPNSFKAKAEEVADARSSCAIS